MTALQAALAGVSGGATGYAQYQRQQKEEQARQKEQERQALRDALATRQFEAQYGPEAMAREEKRIAGERAFQLQRDAAQTAARLEEARISANAATTRDREERAAEKAKAEQLAEAWWNQTVVRRGEEGSASPERLAAGRRAAEVFNRLRAAPGGRSKTPQEIMAAAYAAEVSPARRQQAALETTPAADDSFIGRQARGAGEEPKLPPNQLPAGVNIEQYNTDVGYRRFINRQIAGGR